MVSWLLPSSGWHSGLAEGTKKKGELWKLKRKNLEKERKTILQFLQIKIICQCTFKIIW